MSSDNSDTAEAFQQLGERLAALERHVFEQDKEMLAMSRQLEQLRSALLGLRDRLSEPSNGAGGAVGGDAAHAHDAERPPHY